MRGVCGVCCLARARKTPCSAASLCIPTSAPETTKGRLDGETPKSPINGGRVHPGSLGETTGAWAPSYTRSVKRDRAGGQPPSRAIGGQIHLGWA